MINYKTNLPHSRGKMELLRKACSNPKYSHIHTAFAETIAAETAAAETILGVETTLELLGLLLLLD